LTVVARWFFALFATLALGLAAEAAGPDGVALAAPSNASEDVSFTEIVGAQVPLDLLFRDEKEQPITLRQAFDGKPTILALVYYRCPRLCTEVLNDLMDAMRALPPDFTAGQKFNVVAVSFDPKEHADLASFKRNHYLEHYGREGADWRFLTGSKESVAALTEAVGFKYLWDRAFKEYNHPSGIIVLTPDGNASRYFLGLGYKGEYPLKDSKATTTLKMSLIEASDGKLGSVLDRMWLSCYRFDHSTKKYSFYVMGIVRIAGVITMVAMAISVTMFLRLDRRKRAAKAAMVALADAKPMDGQSGGTT